MVKNIKRKKEKNHFFLISQKLEENNCFEENTQECANNKMPKI